MQVSNLTTYWKTQDTKSLSRTSLWLGPWLATCERMHFARRRLGISVMDKGKFKSVIVNHMACIWTDVVGLENWKHTDKNMGGCHGSNISRDLWKNQAWTDLLYLLAVSVVDFFCVSLNTWDYVSRRTFVWWLHHLVAMKIGCERDQDVQKTCLHELRCLPDRSETVLS